MGKLSKCVGAPVVLKGDGELIGNIKNVYFDKIGKIFAYFLIAADGGDLLLPVADNAPKDALLLDSRDKLMPTRDVDLSAYVANVLGMPSYTLGGIFKGGVLDAQFSASGKLTKLTLASGDVSASSIAAVGDVILLKAAKTSSSPRIPRPKEDYPVYILSDEAPHSSGISQAPLPRRDKDADIPARQDAAEPDPQDATPACPQDGANINLSFSADIAKDGRLAPQLPAPAVSLGDGGPLFSQGALNAVLDGDAPSFDPSDRHTPTRVICDYGFLVGRRLSADLTTYAGELLVPANAIISPTIVELARAHGKLVDLTLLSERSDKNAPSRPAF